ncbi:MAG: response regulator [Bacteroidales bacterium]|nr:response regulator [Bacteroidales bacterium]MCM1416530.1 response regulator [bacterium]MCM1424533.1 response regulator [bacterium]
MSKRSFYQEKLYFTLDEHDLLADNQDKIVDMLSKNVAVGVVGGFYEEGFPVYFISSFALNNMGMEYEQFMERTGGKFLEAVYEEDRGIFSKVYPFGEEDVREYRILNGAGEPVWVREVRTESEAGDGRKIWIGAIRLIDAEHRDFLLAQEAIRMLQDAYFRISAIDLDKNTIVNLKFMESEALEVERFNGDYRMTILSCAEHHVAEDDRENFKKIMAADSLKQIFLDGCPSLQFNYLRFLGGGWKWARTELIPVENFSAENPRVMWYVKNISEEKMKETEMMDRLLRTNTELVQAKKELEEANAKIRKSNHMLRRTLSAEEQYRQAIVSEAVFVFNVNVTQNLIEEEFYEIIEDRMEPVLSRMGIQAPCDADDFFLRWSKERIFPEDREVFVQTINTRHLLEAYERGENELIMEIEASGADGTPVVLRHTILMIKDGASGDVLALNNAKDITEIRKKDRETKKALLEAYEAADRASCAKTDFLSKMSHDIRTPMNAIIGMTAIAGTKLHDPKGIEECLSKVSAASKHLLSLINEVLDMSRIESGALTLEEGDCNILDVVENVVHMHSAAAWEKKQKMEFNANGVKNTHVRGDVLRLQQVFSNILSNSIKYTQEGGEIDIHVREKPSAQEQIGCYEFVFQDNGIGMAEDFLRHIYDPFERAEDVRISKVQGTGLGMTISRNIIQMMGGDIQIESEPGEGTIVTITIPLKYQQPGPENRKELEGRNVLVVGDEPFTCDRICILLKKMGVCAEWVLNGTDALKYILKKQERKEEVFAILIDWNVSGGNGIEIVEEIRRQIGLEPPIVALSATDWDDDETEARMAGVDAFVKRPLDKGKLHNVFRGFLYRESTPPPEHALDPIEETDYTGRRILVVEDNDLNREIATEILLMTGAAVEAAENGEEAVEMVEASEKGHYDLILMDLQMPVMNGYEATKALRAMEREDIRNIPIVAMTANAFLEDVKQSKACGMNEHMAKPLDIEQLHQMLARWLGKKKDR